MLQSRKETIRAKAIEIIENQPTGIRYSQLVKQIQEALPDIPVNTIHGNVWNLEAKAPDRVAGGRLGTAGRSVPNARRGAYPLRFRAAWRS